MNIPHKALLIASLILLMPLAGCSIDLTPLAALQTPVVLPTTPAEEATAEEATATAEEVTTEEETVPAEEADAAEPDSAQGVDTVASLAAYLYSGPAQYYEGAGTVFPGQSIRVVGRNATGEWYQLSDGTWITRFAVQGSPEVPVVTAPAGRIIADVVQVLDGDTIEVAFNNETHQVRYLLSNTPQLEQTYGEEAYERNRQLVEGQTVVLEPDTTDIDVYGRWLRYVYLEDERMVNEELIRSGHAQVAAFPPDLQYETRLREVQTEAQSARRGLWAAEVIPFQETATGCRYIVQAGDTIFIIAKRFGITPEALSEANDITDPNLVWKDRELVLPGCQIPGLLGPAPAAEPAD